MMEGVTVSRSPQDAILSDVHRRVEAELESLRLLSVVKIETHKPATADDVIVLELDALCFLSDGSERYLFREAALDHTFGATYPQFPWPLDVHLLGQSAGDAFVVKMTVPDLYPDPDYRGLPGIVRGSLLRVERWTTPLKLTDGMVFLRTGFPTIAALRKAMRDAMLLAAGYVGGVN